MAGLLKRRGQYYAQFYDNSRSPKRKRFSLKATRKREARRRLVKLEEAYLDGEFDPWVDDPWSYDQEEHVPTTTQEALSQFLDRKRQQGRLENTLRTYREVVGLLAQKIGKSTLLDRISTSHLRDFVWEPSLARATQRKRYGHLRTLLRWRMKEYVFRSPSFEGGKRNPKWFRENVSSAFRKAREKAGLRDELSFHSLRHGFCTMLAEAGKSAVVIKEAARHADISTSMRYVHMANEQLKSEVEDAF